MPWPEDHKARTRRRIVQAAAAAFRAGGVAGVRVEDVMARAGLTHGGFYAHFSSKDDLLREAVEYAGSQTIETLSAPLAAVPQAGRLQAVADAYLSPAHIAHPDKGCPLAALGPEIARTGGPTHEALADAVKGRLAWMRDLVAEDGRSAVPDDQVVGTLACMIGGVILARAVGGKDADAVLDGCRAFLRNAARGPGGVSRPRRKTRKRAAAVAYRRREGRRRRT